MSDVSTQPCLVIVPTYNEASNIAPFLDAFLSSTNADVLFVDDGSPDGTARVIKLRQRGEKRIFLLERPRKAGLGSAYVAGFQWGLARDYSILVQMDSDLSHSPEDVPRLLEAVQARGAIVGCRYMEGGATVGWSYPRKLISRTANLFAKLILKVPCMDLTGGFNAWKREVLASVDLAGIKSNGYSFQIELKWRAYHLGYFIGEVPIVFSERRSGRSKMSFTIAAEAFFRILDMKFGSKPKIHRAVPLSFREIR